MIDVPGDCPSSLVERPLSDRDATDLERFFKALADRNRIRIVNLLAGTEDAVCVCKLVPALRLAQPTVSYHLKLLLEAGLIEREQRGRFGFYRIAPGALENIGPLAPRPGSAHALGSAA